MLLNCSICHTHIASLTTNAHMYIATDILDSYVQQLSTIHTISVNNQCCVLISNVGTVVYVWSATDSFQKICILIVSRNQTLFPCGPCAKGPQEKRVWLHETSILMHDVQHFNRFNVLNNVLLNRHSIIIYLCYLSVSVNRRDFIVKIDLIICMFLRLPFGFGRASQYRLWAFCVVPLVPIR